MRSMRQFNSIQQTQQGNPTDRPTGGRRSGGKDTFDDRILMAQHSWRHDQKEAAGVLGGAFEPEEKVRAAVHLMMGREAGCQWTPTGKLRAVCAVCKRSYATKLDGTVRKHTCCPMVE